MPICHEGIHLNIDNLTIARNSQKNLSFLTGFNFLNLVTLSGDKRLDQASRCKIKYIC
jgi:hypothetical protein